MAHLRHSVSKNSQKRSRELKSSFLIILLGVLLLFFGGFNYYRVRILSFTKVPDAAKSAIGAVDAPSEIIIPSINIDLTVDPGQIVNGVWQISQTHATFLTTSAPPATGGNTVIYGHNLKVVFANLPYLSLGQKITIKTKSGKIHNYIANQKFFVGPDRVDLVSPTNFEELTIYTCWGIFDQERVVVKALPTS